MSNDYLLTKLKYYIHKFTFTSVENVVVRFCKLQDAVSLLYDMDRRAWNKKADFWQWSNFIAQHSILSQYLDLGKA